MSKGDTTCPRCGGSGWEAGRFPCAAVPARPPAPAPKPTKAKASKSKAKASKSKAKNK